MVVDGPLAVDDGRLLQGLLVSHLASSLPISDRSSLVALTHSNDIRACQWTEARANEYRTFAQALLSIYNAIAPIHCLPAEILSKIFEECWTGRESLRVGHVCRSWRSVLLDTKRFWTDAVNDGHFTSDDHSTGYLRTMLERSSPRMVRLSLPHFSTSIPQYLALHTRRVVSLEVTCVTNQLVLPLWACLNSGMPCLATLTITFDHDDYRSIFYAPIGDLSLSPAALPRLTRISAPVALFPIFGLPSLQHIILDNPLKNQFLNGRLESERFRKAFTVCAPGLHTLTLIGAAPWMYTTATPLSLPALCHLHVQDTARCCSLLLIHLALPPTTCIHCTNVDGLGLRTTIPIASDAFRSTVGATDRVAIMSTTETISLHCYGGDEERLRVDIPLSLATAPEGSRTARVLRRDSLIQFFRDRARVTGLTVVGQNRADMEMVEWRAFPHLVAAKLCGQKARYAVKNLSRKVDGGPGSICPGLRALQVDCTLVLQHADGLARR